MNGYDDIINLPHYESKTRPRMSNYERAAQFSPFAALKGYEDEIEETARYTEGKAEQDEERINAVNEALVELKGREKERPFVRITYFKADEKKAGGAYFTREGRLKKLDGYAKKLVLEDEIISFENIIEIERIT